MFKQNTSDAQLGLHKGYCAQVISFLNWESVSGTKAVHMVQCLCHVHFILILTVQVMDCAVGMSDTFQCALNP
jgi:hypothetical protein